MLCGRASDASLLPPCCSFCRCFLLQKLTCRVLKADEVHPQLFKGANRKFKKVPWRKIEAERVNKERTPEEAAKRVASLIKKDKARQKRIAAAGIAYEYEPLAAQQAVKPKKTKFS